MGAVIPDRLSAPLAVKEDTEKVTDSHSPVALIPGTGNSPELALPLSTLTRKPPDRFAAPSSIILISKDRLPSA